MARTPKPNGKKPLNIVFRLLGPGLVTGAADDDPSGIATYSQAGAQFGYGLLWTVFLTTPFMIAIQLVSAQIGRVTGKGRKLFSICPALVGHCPCITPRLGKYLQYRC
jgi:Mn2+/Fe2+ NRAMP family transporter